MAYTEKINAIFTKLYFGTKNGKLNWTQESFPDGDNFSINIGGLKIILGSNELKIFDESNELLECVKDFDWPDAGQEYYLLYELARRNALNVDDKLDDLDSQLNQMIE